jgi:putative endopeptidase
MNQIDAAQTPLDLVALAGELARKGTGSLFGYYITQDDKNATKMVFRLYQGGINMPNRDYYFDTDSKTIAVRTAYKDYLLQSLRRLGMNEATAAATATEVYALETRLAQASRKLADLRDPYKNYNKMAIGDLQKQTPALEWAKWLQKANMKGVDTVIVGQPEFFAALNKELMSTPLPVWKAYLKFCHLSDNARYLDDATYMESFTYTKAITGVAEPRPRWKRALDSEEGAMGEVLGQLFVKEYFPETAKKRYSDMVETVRDAYKKRIEALTWMSDSTKAFALDKLAKMKKKVGYPDKWKDFSALQITDTSYVANMQAAAAWWSDYNANKLGKPVDLDEWEMTPQTYNAYYNPSLNEIVMPAGIFAVPGKRDEEIDDAWAYGNVAASTIGHEITHGFDDQGRQYDAAGNLKNWWTKQDEAEFSKRAQGIIRQFNEFVPVDTLHVNGEATQGENIADLGGMLLGLDAFKQTETYKQGKAINGLTALQRFFLGWAFAWMNQIRPEQLATRLKTDVHAPAKERVNGPVVNIPDWYEAFGVKQGAKMYRPDSLRVSIW